MTIKRAINKVKVKYWHFFIDSANATPYYLRLNKDAHCVLLTFAGVVVQLVRIPACHAGGRGFESRPLRQQYYVSSK